MYLLTTSGDTKVLPQAIKMHERRPSLDYHGKRMHSEYNVDEEDEDCFWFVIDPVKNIQGAFFNCSSLFSVPKWKTTGSQSDILSHEILDVQNILVGWTTFFFLVLKFGRNS